MRGSLTDFALTFEDACRAPPLRLDFFVLESLESL
jgi:hypothetical protein